MAKTKIKVRVKATVEIDVGVWEGGSCDLDKMFDQVRKEGKQKLQKMLGEKGAVVGEPNVQLIVIEEEG